MRASIKIVSGNLTEMMKREGDHVSKAIAGAFREAGDKIKKDGRASIAAGGFSSRWQNALRVSVKPTSIFVHHNIPYAGQFEEPEPIEGNIWLPIEQNLPGGKQRWTPHLFENSVGRLVKVNSGDRQILLGQVSVNSRNKPLGQRALARRNSSVAQKKAWLPVFVGVHSVHDPKRFDIKSVVENAADQLADIFAGQLEETDG